MYLNLKSRFKSYSDKEFLESIKKGDEAALDYLYTKHYRMMVNMIIKNSGTEVEAKDIFQEALIVFWRKAMSPDFELTSKISTYIYSICQNLWRKELDRKKRLSYEEADGIQESNFDKKEKEKLVHQCINALGDTCKQVLTLYYFDGMSMNDIAEKLGFSNADTAKTKKYKCKKELDAIVKTRFSKEDFLD